ncbi:hypothetical protein NDU88_012555 [Pleurodeles waltl]|uniref:Uncharacterized protein n=1 Tax=Pleurodeles waltl TaxID=8319 RepID=A0AAV7R0H1_PLEWA|nr:hypothetical protein NDU88_012555 [Pleurodeles waltl]
MFRSLHPALSRTHIYVKPLERLVNQEVCNRSSCAENKRPPYLAFPLTGMADADGFQMDGLRYQDGLKSHDERDRVGIPPASCSGVECSCRFHSGIPLWDPPFHWPP